MAIQSDHIFLYVIRILLTMRKKLTLPSFLILFKQWASSQQEKISSDMIENAPIVRT
jgi:hypothetical protein